MRSRLLQAHSLRCQFGEGTEATWDAGRPNIERSELDPDGDGEVTFDAIDPEAGTARIIGSLGADDAAAIRTEAGLTFVETSQTGNLMFTTVFASTVAGTGRYIAVDSRHVGWPTTWPESPDGDPVSPFPSQYHGTCEILQ